MTLETDYVPRSGLCSSHVHLSPELLLEYLKDQERVPWPLVTQLTRPSCSAVFLVLHLSVKLGGMKEIPMGLTKVNIKPYPKTML